MSLWMHEADAPTVGLATVADLAYIDPMATRRLSDDDDALWARLEAGADELAGAAAEAHLRAGRAIYYSEPGTPEGLMIRETPDGLKCLVRIVIAGNEVHETFV